MGASRPLNGRKGWAGGSKKISRGLFANKKSFLFAKRSLKQASRPASGREATRPASGREVPLVFQTQTSILRRIYFVEFMFHKHFEIQTFFKYKIYSPYSYVCI
jgi:hypothetical protein